jgi:metal-responsive CopG/Arc/MetJ family transcriptional regulator
MTTFEVDDQMLQTLDDMQAHYNLKSRSAVFKKAIALLRIAVTHEQPDGSLVLISPEGNPVTVVMK